MSNPLKSVEKEVKRGVESVRKEGRRVDEALGLRAPKPKPMAEAPDLDNLIAADLVKRRTRERNRGRASTILARDTLGA